jgi:uncharacterized protein with HEPN domain
MKKDDTVYLLHILDAMDLIAEYTKLPWAKMIGIRNKVIHEYFNVNYSVVWDTINED